MAVLLLLEACILHTVVRLALSIVIITTIMAIITSVIPVDPGAVV
jgi:hypothetical protein